MLRGMWGGGVFHQLLSKNDPNLLSTMHNNVKLSLGCKKFVFNGKSCGRGEGGGGGVERQVFVIILTTSMVIRSRVIFIYFSVFL